MTRLFIVNPDSQTVKTKGSVLGRVEANGDTSIEFLDDFTIMPDIAARALASDVRHVFIEGGDGTAHGVLTAFLALQDQYETLPNFTLLAGGMTNQVARNIGIKSPSAQRVSSLLKNGPRKTHQVPLLRIDTGQASPAFGFLFSTGAIPSATDYCTEQMHGRGVGGTAAVAATILRGVAGSKAARDHMMPSTPLSLRIDREHDQTRIDAPHLGTVVTTLPGLIMKLDPFWGQGSGALRLTYASSDAGHLVRNLAGLWMGRKHISRAKDGIESFNAHALHYDYNGPCVLDGERIVTADGYIDIRPTAPVTFVT